MERLTTTLEGNTYFAKGKYPPTTLCAEMETWEVRQCMHRLSEYEDTGLSPEEIKGLQITINNLVKRNDALYLLYQGERKEAEHWEREAKKWCAELGENKLKG